MSLGRTQDTDALVLRVVDYGESDRIVSLLTRDSGRLSALARGARRSRKRFAGALQTGTLLRVSYREGRGELVFLESADVRDAFEGTRQQLGRLALSAAVLELLRELCPENIAEGGLFDVAHAALCRIDAEAPRQELLLAFHAHLLARLGHGPVLDSCVVSGAEAPEGKRAYFDPARGGVVSRAAGGGPMLLDWPTRQALLAAFTDPDPGPLPWSAETRGAALGLLAAFTARQLGKELRATAFVVDVLGAD